MLTLPSVYLSFACYVFVVFELLLLLLHPEDRRRRTAAIFLKPAWTLGALASLLHVFAAFTHHHGWSHQAALRDTARQTRELFGLDWGGGLYFNYLFIAVWTADAVWMWTAGSPFRYWTARPLWINAAVHGFMAFMFFNATVVFGDGWTRWSGVAATALLLGVTALLLPDKRRRRSTPHR
jgi:hypothetical protein